MSTVRKTAIIVGILYIIGTVSGVLSLVFSGPILEAPETLTEVFAAVTANENQVIIGALFVLIMGLALVMVPVMMFPILRKHNEPLALGYVVFRSVLEGVIYLMIVLDWLLLITFSREYGAAGAADASSLQAVGTVLVEAGDWLGCISSIVFSLGALMFYSVLYQTKLVPRWLSGWGLVAGVLYVASGLLGLFVVFAPSSTIATVLDMPMALQEMVLAVWLIVKGFNSSAIASDAASF
jgi:hypothetical protein